MFYSGVTQNNYLSLLFNLCINGLARYISIVQNVMLIKAGIDRVNILSYADDIVLLVKYRLEKNARMNE